MKLDYFCDNERSYFYDTVIKNIDNHKFECNCKCKNCYHLKKCEKKMTNKLYCIKALFSIKDNGIFKENIVIMTNYEDSFDLAFMELKKKYDLIKLHHSEAIINEFKTYIEEFEL